MPSIQKHRKVVQDGNEKPVSWILLRVFAVLLLLGLGTVRGYEEQMYFVSEIRIDGTMQEGDVCLLQKESIVLWIVYHTEPLRHVVSEKGCMGDRYGNIPPKFMKVLEEEGVVMALPAPRYHRPQILFLGFLALTGFWIIMFPAINSIAPRKW